jgi:hypothetical protein
VGLWWRTKPSVLWNQVATIGRARLLAEALDRVVPRAEFAVLAFEIQFPTDLLLALGMLGIRTAAVQERPATAFRAIVPFAVDTLLTAGPGFTDAVHHSRAIATQHVVDVGLWRTDLALSARSKARPDFVEEAAGQGSRLVVVLPFDLRPGEDPREYPLVTGTQAVNDFIADIVRLARSMPTVSFVVRGKSSLWMEHPSCLEAVSLVEAQENVIADREFDTPGRSYSIAAWADAVIGRPTSLIDELLAIGTPCVVHDFAGNATNIARTTYRYLPRHLWAESAEELAEKVTAILRDGGAGFRAQWEPGRAALYGDYCDGHVRERVRKVLQGLAQGPSVAPHMEG